MLVPGTELVCELCGTIHAVHSVLQPLLIPLFQWRAILPFQDTVTNGPAELHAPIFALGRRRKAVNSEHLSCRAAPESLVHYHLPFIFFFELLPFALHFLVEPYFLNCSLSLHLV